MKEKRVSPLDPEEEKVRHSAAHILAMAILRFWPEAQFAAGPPVEGGFYYDVELPHRISPEDFPKLEEEMRRIIAARLPFVRRVVSRKEAWELAERGRLAALGERPYPSHYKLDILKSIPPEEPISLYWTGEFVDLCAGPHVEHTGEIGAVRLTHVASAYYRGDPKNPQLQRVYGVAFRTQQELDQYCQNLEKARQRDHRKLGKELDLFEIDELVGPGLVLWKPRGAIIRQELQQFLSEELEKRGYQQVVTPHVARLELYQISGHFPYYKESQFPPIVDPETLAKLAGEDASCAQLSNWLEEGKVEGFLVKPMNCPMHIRIFASRPRSYRELPMRLAEFGTVYRWEKSGELTGLSRVRGFTQDDAHIFCMPQQVEGEIRGCLELVQKVLQTLGMSDYRVRLGLRKEGAEKYVGTRENWDKAERALRTVAQELGIPYQEEPGEAAFYGPKIDFLVRDAMGRQWQLGTVQVDYNLPERFELVYTGPDNAPHRPVMIHRAPFGSLERLVAMLLEHFGGALPLWLAPEQVRIVPVTDQELAYARERCQELLDYRIRATVEEGRETLRAKIRLAIVQKVPYVCIVGKNECARCQVSVRGYRSGDLGVMDWPVFVKRLLAERASRSCSLA
ncbi:threonine--tRNA ligase [Candidatus Methylacidithermus pantelleriae]|uniref:Threonine--tRNA ligase n=1 Tax=Candidatus Methylacidithermus pantelleriae TaxID=2744239 RepID=A0A8J2FRI2_9BACT|nr:threonine--tRNA ligase [Candidatus Methylacidithermus pantelleriae]CAF0688997.1 Threonine--tRNA ligase [Candidatus Methylacidithermus pantelleriae]